MLDVALDNEKYAALVKDLAIPPRPQVVSVLFEEMSKDVPDLLRITKQISADVGLAAAMLKAVNSPLFRRSRSITSVSKAVDLLGLRNVSGIATGLVIRHAIGGGDKAPGLERFWDSAEKVALACGFLARHLRGIPVDEAYSYGLFHNCGIPLLLRRFPNYREVLIRANNDPEAASFTDVEDQAIGTNHAVVGYFMARSWQLAESMSQAILYHHDLGVFAGEHSLPVATLNFIALGHMAERIDFLASRTAEDVEWDRVKRKVLRHFGLNEEEFAELADDALAELKAG